MDGHFLNMARLWRGENGQPAVINVVLYWREIRKLMRKCVSVYFHYGQEHLLCNFAGCGAGLVLFSCARRIVYFRKHTHTNTNVF